MQNDQQKRTTAKRIIIVAIVLVAIFATGVGVALLLKGVSNFAKNQSGTSTGTDSETKTSNVPSAASIIAGYMAPENVRVLSTGYLFQQDTTAPSRITYKADGQKYEVSLSTEHYALFYAKDGAAHADAATVQAQTTAYMQENGFQKSAASSSAFMDTYVNSGNVCQLTKAPESTPAYYLMACADKSDVDKEYASIEKLLGLYKKSNQVGTFTRALSATITSGNKTMTTVSLTEPGKHPVLLFAAVNDNWEYIGDLGSGNEATSNGKYSVSSQVQSAIHDPKYGDFLVKYLQ
jgi:hypothetical protein